MTACPHCGKPLKVIPVVYGYPAPEAFDAEQRGELVIAGCMRGEDDAPYACTNCGGGIWSALTGDRPRFRPVE